MIIPKGTRDTLQNHLNSIDPHIKFTVEPNEQGATPFLDTSPRPSGNEIITFVCRKPTHTDRYLDFKSNYPINVSQMWCSTPEILAQEIDHLGKVLKYNNYPQWMIDLQSRSDQELLLTFVSVSYFLGNKRHSLSKIDHSTILDQDMSQVAWETKEAIHKEVRFWTLWVKWLFPVYLILYLVSGSKINAYQLCLMNDLCPKIT